MGTEPGLRERKKLATRNALSWAAMRLAVERGLDNVLVEDIAAEAGVSTRTFNNYFASKQEAICAIAVDRARRVGDALRERPADEPLWEALAAVVLEHYQGTGQEGITAAEDDWRAGVQVVTSHPSLTGEFLKAQLAMNEALAAAIAERTGTDVQRDLYPRLVAGAVTTATDAAIDCWLHSDGSEPVAQLVLLALDQFAAGLPTP